MSFWNFGWLTGADARKDINNANKKATNYMQTGRNEADAYKNQAYGLYDPIAQQGRAAYDMYNNALGINGADKAATAASSIYNNPLFNGMNNYAQKETQALFNARGDSAGGNAQWAAQDVLQKNMMNYLNMLAGVGNRGDNAINNQANIRLGQGDLAYGYGGTLAGNAINKGNALASTRNQLAQNLIGMTGAVMGGGYRPMQYGNNNTTSGNQNAWNGWNPTSSNNLSQYLPWNWRS